MKRLNKLPPDAGFGSRSEEPDVSISGPLLPPKAVIRADMPGGRVRANTEHGGLLAQLVGKLLQMLELGMEASGERVHRAAVGVVGGVGDELVVEAEARVG